MDEIWTTYRLLKAEWEVNSRLNGVVDLISVKDSLYRIDRRYPNWFIWKHDGDILKAIPKFLVPDDCFQAVLKVFKKMGGRYVRYQSVYYFEVVVGDNLKIPALSTSNRDGYEEK